MNKHFQFTVLLSILVFLYTPAGFSQQDEATATQAAETDADETASEKEASPAGQEVEINEDNYRQFMELRDARQQRDMLPENSYQSQAGAQKIDKLPEESQKHLRNELREIIIQGDQWQPGDEGTEYPYVPSNAASTNPALQKQEAGAWGELVDNYHKREAEIYANASRSQAASATAGAAGEGSAQGSGEGEGEGEGSGNTGKGGEGQQASEQNSSNQNSTAGSYSPNASNDPNAKSTAGVSQNAMEFLKGQGNQLANAGEANGASSDGNNGQADAQADGQSDGQAQSGQAQDGQQTSDEQNRTASASAESSPSPSPDEPESDSTAGASQNALEYLMGNTTPTSQEGTLTIEDLMNAQGIGNATSTGSPSSSANDEENPDKPPPDNGGGN